MSDTPKQAGANPSRGLLWLHDIAGELVAERDRLRSQVAALRAALAPVGARAVAAPDDWAVRLGNAEMGAVRDALRETAP